MIAVSSCRRPNERINSFVKDLSHSLRNSIVIRRGKMSLRELVDSAVDRGADRLLTVSRRYGGPGAIHLQRLKDGDAHLTYPVIFLRSVRLRREYPIEGRFFAEAVTANDGKIELDLSNPLARFLDLPFLSGGGTFSSFHVARDSSRRLSICLTSPAAVREVGPSFVVHHLSWNLLETEDDEGHES